ncbi:MAG TPA: nucleotidyltransferase domain-containing protein [Nitrospiria bacterium]|nr:nucleotidyltransferase domain-containing protein [Nitrospiria bacterium]
MTFPYKDAVIRCVRDRLPDVRAIYRYGSAGTERERPDSDVDIAVLPAAPLSPETRLALSGDLGGVMGRSVDLVDLLAAPTVLRAHIVASGERLFCADERACAVFEDYAFSSYAKFSDERRELVADILGRGSVHGR